jgi:hypothetical protein
MAARLNQRREIPVAKLSFCSTMGLGFWKAIGDGGNYPIFNCLRPLIGRPLIGGGAVDATARAPIVPIIFKEKPSRPYPPLWR